MPERRAGPVAGGDATDSSGTGPPSTADLKARREARGLSVEEVAAATRIPVPHVRAVEEGRLQDLPEGPWAQAYERALRAHLGLDEAPATTTSEAAPPTRPPPSGVPLWAVRLLAAVSVLLLAAVIGWQAWSLYGPPPSDEVAPTAQQPDQFVRVWTRRNTRLRVHVDHELVLDRVVVGGEELSFSGHDRVEIEIPAVAAARFEYNGRTIVPQGRQEHPRRLVFVDDVGPAAPKDAPPPEGAP